MNGITADFVDDETMPEEPGRFKSIIVPASYVLSQETAVKIANFARRGGTVILAGTSGIADPWTKKYECLGGPAWAELKWKAPEFKADIVAIDFVGDAKTSGQKNLPDALVVGGEKQPVPIIDETKMFKGAGVGAMPDAEELRDATGTVVGWKRPWGKGRVIAYSTIPDSYGANPHPSRNHSAWIKQLIEMAGLRYTGRWNSGKIEGTAGMHGEGAPVVEVVVRARKGKEAKEKFVFVLNQGGAGQGTVEVPVADGNWLLDDAISGNPVTGYAIANGVFSQKLEIKPWEYRVFHLKIK
jgi:hypothetical protein